MKVIECINVNKSFDKDIVIKKFSYSFETGLIYAIYGRSGSGKSTLLNLIGKLEKPTDGEILYFKNGTLDKSNRTLLYRNRIAYLFQNYALIDDKTVKQNLEIALEYVKSDNKLELMEKALEQVDLSGCLNRKIFTLSGGEQQRIALARIMLRESDIILADEPTGNLDEDNAKIIFKIFNDFKAKGKTVILATHDRNLIDGCDEKIELKEEMKSGTITASETPTLKNG